MITQRLAVPGISTLALVSTLAAAPAQSQPPADQPNIVYIMTDDLDTSLVRYMSEVQMMINEGVVFTNYIVTNSQCCPSRAGYMTGKYPQNNEVRNNVWPLGGVGAFLANDERESVGVYLDQAGYRTGFMGKYLNQYQPNGHDDGSGNQPDYPLAYVPAGWDEAWLVGKGYQHFNYTLTKRTSGSSSLVQVSGIDATNYLTDRMTTQATDFIGRNAAEPFFLTLAPFAVHLSGRSDPEGRSVQYPPAPRDRRDSLRRPPEWSEPEFRNGDCGVLISGCNNVIFPPTPETFNTLVQNGAAWHPSTLMTDQEVRTAARYYVQRVQMAQSVNDLINKVRAALVTAGVADATYLIFGSDNGFHLGDHALIAGKNSPYDHDVRLPFVVVPPGGTTPRQEIALVSNIDLLPTFAEIAGVTSFAEPIDGQSFQQMLDRPLSTVPNRSTALIQFLDKPQQDRADPDRATGRDVSVPSFYALRTSTYLYADYGALDVVPPEDHLSAEYFDLVTDPNQLINIYDTLSTERRAALNAALLDYAACEGRTCALAGQVAP